MTTRLVPRALALDGEDADGVDVLGVALELQRHEGVETLADAVVTLLMDLLGCRQVTVWGQEWPEQTMRMLASTGQGGDPARFVLEARGQTVGVLEVDADRAAIRRVGRVAPWIAVVLERLHFAARVRRESDIGFRLREACRRWSLTRRQAQVVELVVQGATNKEVAGALGCRETTVELHMSNILEKVDADNRTALTARFWLET